MRQLLSGGWASVAAGGRLGTSVAAGRRLGASVAAGGRLGTSVAAGGRPLLGGMAGVAALGAGFRRLVLTVSVRSPIRRVKNWSPRAMTA